MYQLSDWQKHWVDNETPWTGDNVNNVLIEALPKLRAQYGLQLGGQALVPLAGDSPAVRILYDEGFAVTAVEYVPEAAARMKSLFPELRFDTLESAAGTEFSAPRIRILAQDFLIFSAPAKFSFVYDRAAYVALPSERRVKYAQIIVDSLAPKGLLLSRTAEIIGGDWKGPPFSIPFAEVSTAFPGLELLEHTFQPSVPTQERYVQAGISELRHVNCVFRKRG